MSDFWEFFDEFCYAVFTNPFMVSFLAASVLLLIFDNFRLFLCVPKTKDDHFVRTLDLIAYWLEDQILRLICSTEKGFYFAYKAGWLKPGVHFFECGQDCDKCPKYNDCMSEDRVLRDVTQIPGRNRRQDPEDVLQEVDL